MELREGSVRTLSALAVEIRREEGPSSDHPRDPSEGLYLEFQILGCQHRVLTSPIGSDLSCRAPHWKSQSLSFPSPQPSPAGG